MASWQRGWGNFWWQSPSGSVNDPNVQIVYDGSQGATATTPPGSGASTPTSTGSAPGGQWVNGWGVWIWTPSGSVNDPQAYSVPYGSAGSSATAPPTSGPHTGSTSTTPTPVASTPTSATDPQLASSAKALIDGELGQYGLSTLSSWAWAKWQAGESIDQIMLELRSTPEYNARFPAMAALAKSGHAISEAQYIQYETSVSQIFKAAGLPANFYDQPTDFTNFLTNNISTSELQSRVQDYQQAAYSAPPEVRNALQSLYGVTPGELTAFFIDPDKALPLIQQRFNAAEAAGWSQKTGFGNLNQAQAEQVGNLGLSEGQFSQQFGTLAGLNPLFSPLQGTTEGTIGTQTALDATFANNAADQAIIEQRKQERLAEFAGGGTVATTSTGAVGAGQAF